MSDFKWYGEDADSVIIQPTYATAVYLNEAQDLVIRQQDATGNEDAVIVIPKIFLTKFMEKIEELQQEIS